MAKITRLSAEQREDLVAYLDGELEEAQSQDIEQVLADSVVARHDVDMLSRTWDLLNVLPGVKVSEEFSRKTLSSIRAAEASGSLVGEAVSRTARRGALLAAWAALVVICAVLGFQATHRWVPDPNDELLDNFDIIENLDDYSEVGDITFLKALKANHTLAEHNEPSGR
jgi:anti-sigma factor RsiW